MSKPRNWHCACQPGILGPPQPSLPTEVLSLAESLTSGPPISWKFSRSPDDTCLSLVWRLQPAPPKPSLTFPAPLLSVLQSYDHDAASWSFDATETELLFEITWPSARPSIPVSSSKPSTPSRTVPDNDAGYFSASPASPEASFSTSMSTSPLSPIPLEFDQLTEAETRPEVQFSRNHEQASQATTPLSSTACQTSMLSPPACNAATQTEVIPVKTPNQTSNSVAVSTSDTTSSQTDPLPAVVSLARAHAQTQCHAMPTATSLSSSACQTSLSTACAKTQTLFPFTNAASTQTKSVKFVIPEVLPTTQPNHDKSQHQRKTKRKQPSPKKSPCAPIPTTTTCPLCGDVFQPPIISTHLDHCPATSRFQPSINNITKELPDPATVALLPILLPLLSITMSNPTFPPSRDAVLITKAINAMNMSLFGVNLTANINAAIELELLTVSKQAKSAAKQSTVAVPSTTSNPQPTTHQSDHLVVEESARFDFDSDTELNDMYDELDELEDFDEELVDEMNAFLTGCPPGCAGVDG